MTRKEYRDYCDRLAEFFSHGLRNLSMVYDDDGDGESYFSWQRCEVCQRRFGGTRYDCNGWNDKTKEVEEYSACDDCVYYALNTGAGRYEPKCKSMKL